MYNAVHACMSQELYLQEEYSKDKQLNFPSLDRTIPGMETDRDNMLLLGLIVFISSVATIVQIHFFNSHSSIKEQITSEYKKMTLLTSNYIVHIIYST